MLLTSIRRSFQEISKLCSMHSAVCVLLCASAISPHNGVKASGVLNAALNKPADQGPSTFQICFGGLAVDGYSESTDYRRCAHTTAGNPQWWMVDLQDEHWIHRVSVLNRGDCCNDRLQNFTVDIFAEDPRKMPGFPEMLGNVCARWKPAVGLAQWVELTCDAGPIFGRFVRVVKWGLSYLTLCEVNVSGYKCPTLVVRKFDRIQSKTPLANGEDFLGVFSSPMKCAMELSAWDHITVYLYRRQDGSCKGYANPTWSESADDQWEAYREVE